MANLEDRILAKVEADPNGGCWLWGGTLSQEGYGRIMVDRKQKMAHRVSWEAHTDADPGDQCVCHRCDVRACVNPAHLFLGSSADNNRDRAAKGRSFIRRGDGNPVAKLTEADVRDVLRRLATGESQASLGREYGVHQSTISDIKTAQHWAYLQGN